MPRVSVIIPAYNRAHLIGETLESVLNQTFKDLEVIIVDDGSTDDTKSVVSRYNGPIKYIYQSNQGLPGARNTGISAANGEYIAFTDSDDLWISDKLQRQVDLLDAEPQVGMVYCGYQFVGASCEYLPLPEIYRLHPLQRGCILRDLFRFDFIPSTTVMVRRRCLDETGPFDTTLNLASEDWDLWLRFAKRYEISYVDKTLALIRVHDGNWASERVAVGTVQVILKHLSSEDTRAALGNEWKPVYRDRYIAVANYYYNSGEMKKARKFYLKALKVDSSSFLDSRVHFLILKSLMGKRVITTARNTRNALSK